MWIGIPHLPHVSDTFHSLSYNLRDLPSEEYFASRWHVLPSLVCAQNFLATAVLTKALFPCVAEIIQAWNGFPVQEHQLPNTPRPLQQGGWMHLPWEKDFLAPPPDGIIPVKPPNWQK
jgi:hypothetical protein